MDGKLKSIYKKLYSAFGPQNWWPGDTPFEVAVGAILTQNTNWGNVEKAIGNLKKAGALDAFSIDQMTEKNLASLIKPSGYYNVKAKRLKAFISFLIENYQGKIEKMKKEETGALREKLLSVKGIGEETADSILLYALGKKVFVIDAYTKRVLLRHRMLAEGEPYSKYQETFHSALKPDRGVFNEYHALFVKLGKEYCKPKPLCDACPLGEGL